MADWTILGVKRMKMKLRFDAPCNVTETSNAYTHATQEGLKGKITLLVIVRLFFYRKKKSNLSKAT